MAKSGKSRSTMARLGIGTLLAAGAVVTTALPAHAASGYIDCRPGGPFKVLTSSYGAGIHTHFLNGYSATTAVPGGGSIYWPSSKGRYGNWSINANGGASCY
jgi:hypothetical protein